jgi:type IV pilus assembly protein PilA
MIVVAIIGILASIAIPNYQKYQAKARTSEGKIQLAAAYTAQKSFYIEYSSYTGCLAAAGYAPDLGTTSANAAQRFYSTGFNTASAGSTCGPTAGTACEASWSNGNPTCTADVDGSTTGGPPAKPNGTYWSANKVAYPSSTLPGANAANLPNTSATSTTFTLGAAGNINPTTSTIYDQWTINEGKVVSQTTVGY